MNSLGKQASAALFTDRDKAEEAWGVLSKAGIASALITDPGMLGKYELSLMVDRADLENAQKLLTQVPPLRGTQERSD